MQASSAFQYCGVLLGLQACQPCVFVRLPKALSALQTPLIKWCTRSGISVVVNICSPGQWCQHAHFRV